MVAEESQSIAAKTLAHGIGQFFKDRTRPESRWANCPHNCTIRYRNAQGQQTGEAGFSNQEKATARLTEIYREKRELAAKNPSKAEHIRKYGSLRFKEYVTEWSAGAGHDTEVTSLVTGR
ncbi:hypothetical protein [Streptacidiphilus sp. MAP5-3]|uniref:hypothetical protein n=1 Tax=unclassified Streptacidiphilus TaxID=2643834 RepID=UPI0035115E4A